MIFGIIGIGNPLRQDDGIGIVLLHKLRDEHHNLPHDIDFIDGGTGGMNLLHFLSKYSTVLVIDAVQLNEKPGAYKVFTPNELNKQSLSTQSSTHEPGLLAVLELSNQLHEAPETLRIFGIQPKTLAPGTTLSPELQNAVPLLFSALKEEISLIYTKKDKKSASYLR